MVISPTFTELLVIILVSKSKTITSGALLVPAFSCVVITLALEVNGEVRLQFRHGLSLFDCLTRRPLHSVGSASVLGNFELQLFELFGVEHLKVVVVVHEGNLTLGERTHPFLGLEHHTVDVVVGGNVGVGFESKARRDGGVVGVAIVHELGIEPFETHRPQVLDIHLVDWVVFLHGNVQPQLGEFLGRLRVFEYLVLRLPDRRPKILIRGIGFVIILVASYVLVPNSSLLNVLVIIDGTTLISPAYINKIRAANINIKFL